MVVAVLNLNRPFAWLCFSTFLSTGAHAQVLDILPESVDAKAWIILDPQSKQVIAEHAADQRRSPASLTKMMVGYLTLKALDDKKIALHQVVTVPDIVRTVAADESRLKLKPNDQITVEELLASLLIMSANDSALTLATLIAGDVPNFLKLMNSTAQELGMSNTHFSNPAGLTMADHYMSARDVALLAQAIVTNTPLYLRYSAQPTFSYHAIEHHATNLLLNKYAGVVDGFKTGYTQDAGYNLALTAHKVDQNTQQYRRLVVIVMGSSSRQKRADEAEKLMNIAYNYTQTKPLITQSYKIASLPIINGEYSSYSVMLHPTQSTYTLSLLPQPMRLDSKQFDAARQRFVLDRQTQQYLEPLTAPKQLKYQTTLLVDQLTAPMQQTAFPLAELKISQFDQEIHKMQVTHHIELSEAGVWQKICDWFQGLINNFNGTQPKSAVYQIPSQ